MRLLLEVCVFDLKAELLGRVKTPGCPWISWPTGG